VKISIARLKEIIMEEVARATAIEGALEEEDVPGSEGYEAGIEAEKKKKKEAAKRASLEYYLQGYEGHGTQGRMREESLNIEIVDDE
jgi:hypothetical protein